MVKNIKFKSPYVACRDFKIVDKEFFDHLKEIESQKAKRYCAVVRVGGNTSSGSDPRVITD